jgi:hypothetical protein
MKRFHFLLIGFALCAAVAVGYSDSHEIKKDTIQVNKETAYLTDFYASINFVAELPVIFVLDAPYLGRPASNHIEVSEELTDVIVIRIRPPPEKVQKSDYNFS